MPRSAIRTSRDVALALGIAAAAFAALMTAQALVVDASAGGATVDPAPAALEYAA